MEKMRVSEHLKLVDTYRQKGSYDLALKEIEMLLQNNPKDETVLLEWGKTYKMMNRCMDAIEKFAESVRINPDSREALWELGETSRMINNCQLAIREFEEVAKKSPLNEQVHIELSKIFQKNSDFDSAFQELNKAVEINKSNAEIYICLGQLYRKKGEREKAVLNFKQAIALDPNNRNAHLELGRVYEEDKDYERAAKELRTAIKMAPLDTRISLNLIKLYTLQNKEDLANQEAQRILSLNSHHHFIHDTILNEIEIIQKKTVIKSKVKRLWVTLTSRCNIRCRTCGLWSSPWDIPRKTVDEVIALYPYLERLVWLGGEVFLCEYFDEMFEKALVFPQLQQQIITNGVILNQRWIERIILAKNTELTFSVDGVTKEVYEHIRVGAKFEKLITNIKLANEIKQKSCSKTPMRMNTVIMKSNYHQLEDFIELAKDLGFCQVSIMALHFDQDPEENILYSHVDTKVLEYITNAIPKMRQKAKLYNIDLDILLPTLDVKSKKSEGESKESQPAVPPVAQGVLHCKMPWKYMFICDKGTTYLTGSCVKPIGNIYKNSLDEIWNSTEAQLYRENMLKSQFNDICRPECRTRWEV
jgi:MoaA/NifB/PqqE/SkfB family radical SAM enzyme/Flp pilus assembly protein TadD